MRERESESDDEVMTVTHSLQQLSHLCCLVFYYGMARLGGKYNSGNWKYQKTANTLGNEKIYSNYLSAHLDGSRVIRAQFFDCL